MKKTILTIVAVIVVGGGSFYGGLKYGQSKTQVGGANFANLSPEERQQRFQQFGSAGTRFRGALNSQTGTEFTTGEIITKDAKSITVKLRDSGSRIVFLSDSTEIGKFASGSLADLEIGKSVTVSGTRNSDGSLTAQSIQLRQAPPSSQ